MSEELREKLFYQLGYTLGRVRFLAIEFPEMKKKLEYVQEDLAAIEKILKEVSR